MKLMSTSEIEAAPAKNVIAPVLQGFSLPLHLAFAVLLLSSTFRYVMRHSASANLQILLLAASVAALYTTIAILHTKAKQSALLLVLLVVIWTALVVAAPSFAWCAFSLFFLSRNAFIGQLAYVCAGIVTVATGVGLFRMSGYGDLAMLLGPLAAGVLLTVVYDRIANDAEVQRGLHRQLSLTQSLLLAREREVGVNAERQRVAQEIHDTFTQELASSILHLEAAARTWPGNDAKGQVEQATSLVRKSLSDSRGLVHELSSSVAEATPLSRSIADAASAYLPAADFIVTGAERPVPTEIGHALVRVTQSACSNVSLYSQAKRSAVTLSFLEDSLTLDIYDDGAGFDLETLSPPSESGGYGLRAMRRRIEQLGGTFNVESAPGEGTFIAALVPLTHREGQQ